MREMGGRCARPAPPDPPSPATAYAAPYASPARRIARSNAAQYLIAHRIFLDRDNYEARLEHGIPFMPRGKSVANFIERFFDH